MRSISLLLFSLLFLLPTVKANDIRLDVGYRNLNTNIHFGYDNYPRYCRTRVYFNRPIRVYRTPLYQTETIYIYNTDYETHLMYRPNRVRAYYYR